MSTGQFTRTFTGHVPMLAQCISAWILRQVFIPKAQISFGLLMGTGWQDALCRVPKKQLEILHTFPFNTLFGIGSVGVEGQSGSLSIVQWSGRIGVVLEGKHHLNEGPPEESSAQVRLLTEIVFALGVEHLIMVGACGYYNLRYSVGDVFVARNFYDIDQPIAVSDPSEGFFYADDGIDRQLRNLVMKTAKSIPGISGPRVRQGAYKQTLGPHLGGDHNSIAMRKLGVDAVGMSGWGEMYVTAMRGKKGLVMLLVTDKAGKRSSHEAHLKLGEKMAEPLSELLDGVISALPQIPEANKK